MISPSHHYALGGWLFWCVVFWYVTTIQQIMEGKKAHFALPVLTAQLVLPGPTKCYLSQQLKHLGHY